MADEADHADDAARFWLDGLLAQKKPEGPPPKGECLWCAEPLPAGRRWCDAACRDAWEAAQE